jgi:hypothetical protein
LYSLLLVIAKGGGCFLCMSKKAVDQTIGNCFSPDRLRPQPSLSLSLSLFPSLLHGHSTL